MRRRKFFRQAGCLAAGAVAAGAVLPGAALAASLNETPAGINETPAGINGSAAGSNTSSDREYWVQLMSRIATPVLSNMAKGKLSAAMEVELSPRWDGRDRRVAYMEAFGRLMAGLAPWLTLPDDATGEGKQRRMLREFSLQSLVHSVDAGSPDYLLWNREGQPLVDAAYLAQTFLRAPKVLWEPLDQRTKEGFIREFKQLRRVKTPYNNWLLFAAMVEAFLLYIDEAYDPVRIDWALRKINEWYVGDGWYKDGERFSFDYYNGFVIQPMLVDIQQVLWAKGKANREDYALALKRMQRYADFLERLISPEGSFPAFGRSVTYRTGAFQPLSQLAWMDQLPEGISGAQVRSALTAVKKRMFGQPGVFSGDGWLQLGFAGHQPDLADYYTNSGSVYLCSLSFLPLGLPAGHAFWSSPAEDWTSRKAWSGQSFRKDYAVSY